MDFCWLILFSKIIGNLVAALPEFFAAYKPKNSIIIDYIDYLIYRIYPNFFYKNRILHMNTDRLTFCEIIL